MRYDKTLQDAQRGQKLKDIREASHVMVHSAVTLVHKDARVIAPGQTNDRDVEIIQLASEWPVHRVPLSEHEFLASFKEMAIRCMDRARRCGLIKS